MKINDYPEIEDLTQGDKLIVETPDGTKKIDGSNIIKTDDSTTLDPIVLHGSTLRGKNLGTSFTDEQKEAIQSGTFDDLYIGDYWHINGHNWRIADINYFKYDNIPNSNTVDSQSNNHIIVLPDNIISEGPAYSKNNDSQEFMLGYASTKRGLDDFACSDIFSNAFGSNNLLDIELTLPNSIEAGNSSIVSLGEFVKKCFGMRMSQIYGGYSLTQYKQEGGSLWWYYNYLENRQFALFKLTSEFIKSNKDYYVIDSLAYWGAGIFIDSSGEPCTKDIRYNTTFYGHRPYACVG